MTTPAKPERMTDETFDALGANALDLAGRHGVRIAAETMLLEARRARSEEERLTRTLALEEKFGLAMAYEIGRQIEARLDLELSNASLARERDLAIEAHHNATAERDAAREKATLDEQARDEAIRRGEENTARAEAERDAPREEAERLRASKKRIADGLTKLRAKVECGLNLAEYLRALNELEAGHNGTSEE